MNEPQLPAAQGPRLALPAFVPDFLARPDRPLLVIFLSWLLCAIGAYAIVAVVSVVAPRVATPDFSFYVGKGAFTVLMIAIITPLIETLILAAICLILNLFLPALHTIILGSLIAAIFHSLQAPIWGFVIWWPFLIFSTLFLVWKQRSFALAILMPTIVHGLHNLPVTLKLAYPGLMPSLAI